MIDWMTVSLTCWPRYFNNVNNGYIDLGQVCWFDDKGVYHTDVTEISY